MTNSDKLSNDTISEQEIDALVEERMTSPCLLPGRWLTVIIGREKLSEEEIRHIGSCRHCQRHQKQWIAARELGDLDVDPAAEQWQRSTIPLTDDDVRDWVGQMLPTTAHGLIQTGAFLLGDTGHSSSFRVLNPVGTMLRADRPVFKWNPCSTAVSYRIEVRALDTTGVPDTLVAEASSVVATSWQPADPLPRGHPLQWWVFAYDSLEEVGLAPKPDETSAIFRILTVEELTNVEITESKVQASSIERGLLLLRFGLVDEAAEQFQGAERADPASSDGQLAALWLSRLQVIRGISE